MIIDNKAIGQYLQNLINKAPTGLNEADGESGGYLVAQQMHQAIIDQMQYQSIIYPKCYQVKMEGPGTGIIIPYDNDPLQNEPTTGTRAYWVDEADSKTISKKQLGKRNLVLKKLVVRIPVTDEIKNDVNILANFIIRNASAAISYKVDREILLATGKSIKGIAGDGDEATIEVAASNDITESELKGYIDALHPQAYKNAEWYVSPQQYSVITSINYTADNALDFENGKYYLFGFPLNVVPQLLANPYHVILGDFTRMAVAYRPLRISESQSIRFYNDESEFRIELRIAGGVVAETNELDDGNTYGFFVVPTGGYVGSSSSSSSSSMDSSSSTSKSSSSSSSSMDSSSSSSPTSNSSSSSKDSSSSSSSKDSSSSSSSSSESTNSSSSSSGVGGCRTVYCAQGFTTEGANGTYDYNGIIEGYPDYYNGSYWIWFDTNSGYWAISNDIGDPQNQWISSKDAAGGCPNGVWISENGTVSEGECSSSSSSS